MHCVSFLQPILFEYWVIDIFTPLELFLTSVFSLSLSFLFLYHLHLQFFHRSNDKRYTSPRDWHFKCRDQPSRRALQASPLLEDGYAAFLFSKADCGWHVRDRENWSLNDRGTSRILVQPLERAFMKGWTVSPTTLLT
ncbi:uncharacterized protein LOC122081285 [Macadamia integrifolia]|uniref:uncharacterized protein LOC122081285 n=1 Tax=Macadamia integrifolia TaxID=60698 RepID=UPI001C4E4BFD|nr:uncharacterized protein LOC122081285 [Macadamia integrifolia]